MPTTPTSLVNRLMGAETWTDAVNFGSVVHVFGGANTYSVAQAIAVLPPVVAIAAATTTLTLTQALHAGRVVQLAPTAGLAITPPAATGTGNVYTLVFQATATGGSVTIDAKAGNASDIFYGNVVMNKVGTGITNFGSAANSNLATLNGTTTGGIKGDLIEMVDVATNVWAFFFTGQGSGVIATPFSNH